MRALVSDEGSKIGFTFVKVYDFSIRAFLEWSYPSEWPNRVLAWLPRSDLKSELDILV